MEKIATEVCIKQLFLKGPTTGEGSIAEIIFIVISLFVSTNICLRWLGDTVHMVII